jgi:hypothetical protein
MKKIFFITLIMIPILLYGQSIKVVSSSSDTPLGSSATFSPSTWQKTEGYNSISVAVRSNKSSATKGLKILFATMVNSNYVVVDSVAQTYTTGVMLSISIPITAPYVRVTYTNTNSAQTYFSLVTLLHASQNVNIDADGNLKVVGSITNFPSGAATADNQTNGLQKALTVPQNPNTTFVDSIAHSGGAHVDTAIFNPNGTYSVLTLYIKARTSADTITVKMKSTASGLVWGTNAFGLKDIGSANYGLVETDNTSIIIQANVSRRLQFTVLRGQYVLVCRKVTNSVNRVNSIKISLEGYNL